MPMSVKYQKRGSSDYASKPTRPKYFETVKNKPTAHNVIRNSNYLNSLKKREYLKELLSNLNSPMEFSSMIERG